MTAFGSGALIQALSVNLAFEGVERLLHQHHMDAFSGWAIVAGGFGAGGFLFFLANRAVERRGGALRYPATADAYFLEKKRQELDGILQRLARVELLRALPPEEIEQLIPMVQSVRVDSGELIFRRGDPGDALYLIDRGSVAILADTVPPPPTPGGSRQADGAVGLAERADAAALAGAARLATLGPGQSFGEIAMVSGAPRTATAVAEQEGELLRIGKADFDVAIERSPALRRAVHALSAQRLMNTMRTATADDATRWHDMAAQSIRHLSAAERAEYLAAEGASKGHGGVPLAIFMGSLLDGIPECIVIGASFRSLATFNPTFLVAVFLADLAEAMSSTSGMRLAGFSARRILTMWGGAVVASALAGALGNGFLLAAAPAVITFVEALAGGAILEMLAATMMPVAFEEGGPSVGLATIAGFLSTFLVTAIKIA